MRGADTNIVVRLLAGDDPRQSELARVWFDEGKVFLSQTVVLEVEWVLRGRMGWGRDAVARALGQLLRMPNVVVERGPDAQWALGCHALGGDLADMLQVAAARDCASFATFDRALPRDVGPDSPVPVTVLDAR